MKLNLKARASSFFIIARNLMTGTLRTGDKIQNMPFKINNSIHSTMMASVILVSKKNKQTKKNMSYCSVGLPQIHINPEKTRKKHQNGVFRRIYLIHYNTIILIWAARLGLTLLVIQKVKINHNLNFVNINNLIFCITYHGMLV